MGLVSAVLPRPAPMQGSCLCSAEGFKKSTLFFPPFMPICILIACILNNLFRGWAG